MSASKNGVIEKDISRSVVDLYKGYGVNDLKNNSNRLRAIDLTGVKFILNKKEDKGIDSAFDEQKFKLMSERNGWQIYTNKNVLNRVKLFGVYKVITQDSSIIQTLFDKNFKFQDIVILEEKPKGYDIKKDSQASVYIVSYAPNKIVLQTKSSKDQLVFVSDNFYPGWQAAVDGEKTPIYRANYTFRAVPIHKGTHDVVFTYAPPSFMIGLVVSTISIGCLILLSLFVTITKRKTQKKK